MAKNREVGIRLSVKDADVAKRALEAFGKDGQAALRRIELAGKPASVSLQALNAATGVGKNAIGGFFAGVVAGLVPVLTLTGALSGAQAAMEQFGRIADQSKAAGLDPELFQGVAYQAKLAGIELNETAEAMGLFAQNSGLAAEGRGRMVTALKALNPELLRNIQLATTQEERIRLAADAINQATSAAEKAALAGALFGNRNLAAAFEGGAAAIDVTMEKARELGIIIDRETVARADELGDKFDTATQIIDTRLKKALVNLAPTMVWITDRIADWSGMLAIVLEQFRSVDERQFVRPLQNELADVYNKRALIQDQIKSLEAGLRDGNLIPDFIEENTLQSMRQELAQLESKAQGLFQRITVLQGAPDPNHPRPVVPDVPQTPDLPISEEAKAAIKEAEALIARLRTASEAYAATMADLKEKYDTGLISQETFNRGSAEAALKFAKAADGSDEYATALERLNEARAAGIVSEQDYTDAVADLTKRRLVAQNDWIAGIQLGLLQISEGAKDVSSDIANVVTGWADSLGEQIGQVVRTGKFEWQDLVKTILADIARIATQQMITKPLGNLLGSIFGSIFGGGGVNAASVQLPPLYGDGTDFHPGGWAIVGDKGPELLNLPRGSQVVPNGRAFGGQSVQVNATYNINGSGLSPADLLAVMEEHDRRLMSLVSDRVKKDAKNGAFG